MFFLLSNGRLTFYPFIRGMARYVGHTGLELFGEGILDLSLSALLQLHCNAIVLKYKEEVIGSRVWIYAMP
jgi:hypothetical protein